ncbi:MAG: energy transducer TonB [Pacificimonas sp.]|jgi:protein TonB|nr:energy transducer TonB [Pacificimonas sp.]
MRSSVAAGLLAGLTFLSAPVFASGDWQKDVVRTIQSEQSYPRSAIKRGDQGTARIRVFVGSDGMVTNVEIVEGSGSPILDREALRMPTRAGRVLATPDGRPQIVEIPVVFRIDD